MDIILLLISGAWVSWLISFLVENFRLMIKKTLEIQALQGFGKEFFHEDPVLTGTRWEKVSPEAKDFIKKCLEKDYKKRPSALQCLQHEWLTQTDCNDRFKGTPLNCAPFKYENEANMFAQTN